MYTFKTMRTISFYQTASGKCPVEEHLDSLGDEQVTKITWVLKLIREMDQIPPKYFKKLVNTDDIWEIRADVGRNTFRLLGFFHGRDLIILTNSFQKKSQKTPLKEIRLAEQRRKEFLKRR
jgi:phage-related protein